MKHRFKLVLNIKKIVTILSVLTAILVTLSIIGSYFFNYLGYQSSISGLYVKLFDLNTEGNFPTLFSTLNLLGASVLLALVFIKRSISDHPDRNYWIFLSAVFLFLAMDEALSIHEKVTNMINLVGSEGNISSISERPAIFRYAWVIPYFLVVVVLFLFLFKFLFRLPSSTRKLFIIAGAIFVGGAVGLEFLQGYYDTLYETISGPNYETVVLFTIEETMEMVGVIVFIYAIMKYLAENQETVRITFQQKFKNKRVEQLH